MCEGSPNTYVHEPIVAYLKERGVKINLNSKVSKLRNLNPPILEIYLKKMVPEPRDLEAFDLDPRSLSSSYIYIRKPTTQAPDPETLARNPNRRR